jgi:hypothetical protein
MRHARAIALLSLLTLLATAPLADARKPRPYVKSVSPLRVAVGDTMTVQGFYFRRGYAENTVVFMAKGGRVSYVRSEHSSRRRLTVIVPKKVQRLLPRSTNGLRAPARFRIKVIARRMSRPGRGAVTKPTIGPDVGGDCDKDGIPNPDDTDDDGDFLPDSIEKTARTNECVADSDGDKLLDGWEYMSALDLNRNALPYPGKRPYPNALFADAGVDYDGDGLPAWVEHALWVAGGQKYPIDYSEGNQTTKPEPPGGTPWNDYFAPFGELSDDERDFDNDGLANIIEFSSFFFEPWENYPGVVRPSLTDPDSDGDGLLDGLDDQDHDGVSNIEEFRNGTWAMNPCDPLNRASRTCPRWMNPEAEPEKPQHLCLSRTLLGDGVMWFQYESSEEVSAEELEKFCKRPEDGLGL